jgi:hypothetical protein
MAKKTATLPKVSVIDRRLAHPFGAPSVPITLKDGQPWAIRVVNDRVRTGRVYQMTGMGWTFVEASEIDGRPADFGFREIDGRLVRGEHGEEVLMKMPQADYDAVQHAKARINLKNLQKRDAVAQEVAEKFGPEAGDTVHQNIEISDSREQVELDEESA